uniref:Transmembrane protein 238-like n=1 Tax=Camelus bactrianus TaxID=9837 RepID=A0A9W3GE40_CAMBA|nr:transmembrane protein 238-like [Camelus bactrianus]
MRRRQPRGRQGVPRLRPALGLCLFLCSSQRTGLGRCRHFFWLGVAFDTVGATLLFTGVFADLLFYDLLLYLGSIIIFLSLLWWVFWYTGNIELTSEEALNRSYLLPSATILEALNQTISNRLSLTIGSISNITAGGSWKGLLL